MRWSAVRGLYIMSDSFKRFGISLCVYIRYQVLDCHVVCSKKNYYICEMFHVSVRDETQDQKYSP